MKQYIMDLLLGQEIDIEILKEYLESEQEEEECI